MSIEARDHRETFDEVSRIVIAAALKFADGMAPPLARGDSGRMFAAAAATILGAEFGPAGAAAMLRQLADRLETTSGTKH